MRVTTDLWVSALVRRVFSAGGYAAVMRRGASEAGAVFILVRGRDGLSGLYGPAAQTSYEAARPEERLFSVLQDAVDDAAVAARLERESRFDPDLWVVELEIGAGEAERFFALTTP